jgi:hypothetical protein
VASHTPRVRHRATLFARLPGSGNSARPVNRVI